MFESSWDVRENEVRLKTLLEALLLALLLACGSSIASAQTISSDSALVIKRGNEKYARAEYVAAIEEYRTIPRDAGKNYSVSLYNIGVCYYELGRTEEAMDFYQRA